jgi:phosphoglycolate phosphatase
MTWLTAVVFDMDGTLIDTFEGIGRSLNYAVSQLGLPPLTDEQLRSCMGPPIIQSVKRLYKIDDHVAQKAVDLFRERYGSEDCCRASLYYGMKELLDFLRSQGLRMAVATYKRQDHAEKILSFFHLSDYFTSIRGTDPDNRLTKTDIIRLVLADLDVVQDSAVLVGDTLHDASGAQNVGLCFIGVTYGYGLTSRDDLGNLPCLGLASNIDELKRVIVNA